MSVINRMLQDLDRRMGRPGGETPIGESVRSTPAKARPAIRRELVLVLGALAVGVIAAVQWLAPKAPPAVIAAPPPPVVSAAPPPVVSAVPASAPAVIAPAEAVKVVAAAASAAPAASAAAAPPPAPVPAPAVVALAAPAPAKPAPAAPVAPEPREAAPVTASVPARENEAPPAQPRVARAPKAVPRNPLAEAQTLEQSGRADEARLSLQRTLAANPGDVQARQMLVRLQLDGGNLDEAAALLAEGRRLSPETSAFTLALARIQAERGDVDGAISLLEGGLAAARGEPQHHGLLGALLLRQRRYEPAVQQYLMALRAEPGNANWLVGAGVALENTGRAADALEAYQRVGAGAGLAPETAEFVAERVARLRAAAPVR